MPEMEREIEIIHGARGCERPTNQQSKESQEQQTFSGISFENHAAPNNFCAVSRFICIPAASGRERGSETEREREEL